MKKYKHLLIEKAAPVNDPSQLELEKKIFSKEIALPVVSQEEFSEKMHQWLHSNTNNNLRGLGEYNHREVCIGVTGFIDNLIMKYGIENLQIFEHDYTYYKRLCPDKIWATVGNLIPKQPLLIALPFPGFGDVHQSMSEILDECIEKQIPVFIDGAWMTAATGIDFDFDHPAIQSVAFSLSKGMSLDWNRIGIRYSKVIDPTDSISIANKFATNNIIDMSVGMVYMENFHQSYQWEKYGKLYHEACKQFLLRPTKCLHMARHFNTGAPYGLRDVMLAMLDETNSI